jgi:hypothetical protein
MLRLILVLLVGIPSYLGIGYLVWLLYWTWLPEWSRFGGPGSEPDPLTMAACLFLWPGALAFALLILPMRAGGKLIEHLLLRFTPRLPTAEEEEVERLLNP